MTFLISALVYTRNEQYKSALIHRLLINSVRYGRDEVKLQSHVGDNSCRCLLKRIRLIYFNNQLIFNFGIIYL